MSHKEYLSEDLVRSKLSFVDMARKMWPYLRHYKAQLWTVVVLVLLYVTVGRSLPILFGYAIDEGLKKQNLQTVYYIAAIYLALELSRAFFMFAQDYLSAKLGNRVLYGIREKLLSHVQRLPSSYFDRNPIGRTVTRLTNDVFSLGELFNQGFTAIFVNIIELLSMVIALAILSPSLTVVSLLGAPLLVWHSLYISKKIRELFKESKTELAAINAFTAESINGMKVVQLFDLGEKRRNRFDQRAEKYLKTQVQTVRSFAQMWPMFGFFNTINVVLALGIGAFYLQELGMTIGQLSAFVLILRGFFKPMRTIIERYNQFQNSLTSAERIFTLLEEPLENEGNQDLPKEGFKGRVQLQNLSFRYSDESPWALRKINLDIAAGESVALVGRTGSGKSTFISLLQKLYPYTEGEILIDGVPLREARTQDLRQRVGVVQQDPFIFRGSIADNIRLGNGNISDQQIEEALRLTQGTELLQKFPEGLQGKLEERGANLSVGEKQLIAFSRILAFNPEVLILDEATANIDSHSERLIQSAVETVTRDRTSIIIAHRLSTISHCDRIIVLDHGQILEQGNHWELLKANGRYAELYRLQTQANSQQTDSPGKDPPCSL